MFPRITKVRHLDHYRLELTFDNGQSADMDFAKKILGHGGVFAPLHDVNFFKQVQVDTEAGTLVWPNGVDLDPDVLYSEAMGVPLPEPETI